MAIDLDTLWDFEDPSGSEQRFRKAAETAGGTDRLVALTQAARACGLAGRYDEGLALLDEIAGPGEGDAEVEVRTRLERGRLLRSSGRPVEARPFFEAASRRAAEADLEALHIDALHMLAFDVPPEEAARLNLEALEVARAARSQAARDWDASLLNNLAMAYHDLGDLPRALATFEEALAACERIGVPRKTQIARWMVGWTLRLLGRREEALAVQVALRAELDDAGTHDPYVDEELALLRPPGSRGPGGR